MGERDEGSKVAFDVATRLSHLSKWTDREDLPKLLIHDPEFYAAMGTEIVTPEEWWEWAIFLSRPWFQRAWVLQEAIVGLDRVYVLCGSLFTNLTTFLAGLLIVRARRWELEIFQGNDTNCSSIR